MPTSTELPKKGISSHQPRNAGAEPKLQFPSARQNPTAVVLKKADQPSVPLTARRIQIPSKYLLLEPLPISAYNDNPVFGEFGAAEFLGISPDLLKKWRQRNQGPDYLQYGRRGPVRYELSALKAFRDAHRVEVGPKR